MAAKARILIATVPIYGHVTPLIPLAQRLIARGHEVRWSTTSTFAAQLQAAGIPFVPATFSHELQGFGRDRYVSGGDELEGIAALKVDLKFGFIDNAPRQLRDLQAATIDFTPDLVLCDTACLGARMFAELTGIPLAVLNVVPLVLTSRDTAPFGLGMAPSASAFGRIRNRALNWLVQHVVFRDVQKRWNAVRVAAGLQPAGWLMDATDTAALYLNPSVPGIEYPRSDLAPQVHFIGPISASSDAAWTPPQWWHELDSGIPVVHITQGTIANATPELFAPALAGLADEDVLVVVATGGRPAAELGLDNPPVNTRVEEFIPYAHLLPKVSVVVTNGGYGGVQLALSHGVPLIVAGTTEDKPEVAMRVEWSGAGINLRTAAPRPQAVRDAVRAILDTPGYRAKAQALGEEYGSYDALTLGTELIERLVSATASVSR